MAGLISDAQATAMQAVIARSLDLSLPQERNAPGTDTSGHATENWSSLGNVACNAIKPSATLLQLYAGIIGSQRAEGLRAMSTTDIRQGDRITYDGLKWIVHDVLNNGSYSYTKQYLMVTIT